MSGPWRGRARTERAVAGPSGERAVRGPSGPIDERARTRSTGASRSPVAGSPAPSAGSTAPPSPDGAHRRTEGPYLAVIEPRDRLIAGSRSRSANKLAMPARRRSLDVMIRTIWSPGATAPQRGRTGPPSADRAAERGPGRRAPTAPPMGNPAATASRSSADRAAKGANRAAKGQPRRKGGEPVLTRPAAGSSTSAYRQPRASSG